MKNPDFLETITLMHVFPTEIWLSVLTHLNKFSDYLRVYDSSHYLKATLQTLRTTVLFPDVIQILHKTERLSIDVLISLRLACFFWKSGVDEILHHLDYPMCFSRVTPLFAQANDFAKYKEPYFGNPFLARAIDLGFAPPLGDLSLYYPELMEMLSNFGRHIWYCNIQTFLDPRKPEEQQEFYHKLVQILGLMPNLRRIQFISCSEQGDELVLSLNHFPTLKHLTSVTQKYMPALVLERLARRNPQICEVNCCSLTSELIPVYLKEMPNLKTLSIDIQQIHHFNTFLNCTVVCHLTKLRIQLQSLEVPWKSVFTALESKFGETLQDLWVVLPSLKFYTKGCSLNLPNLKNLSLPIDHSTNLDFILPMKQHLENLDIFYRGCGDNSQQKQPSEGSLKVYECGENLHNSNIWEMFGKLKCLDVRMRPNIKYVCTRGLWKHRMNMILNDFM